VEQIMKVELLKQQLRAASGGTFNLAAGALNVAGVEDLIKARLGGGLTVGDAKPNLDELTIEGLGTVDSMQNRPVKVWFSVDAAARNVTGLLIAYQSGDWSITTSFLKFSGDYLAHYSFNSLALVLSSRPEDDTAKDYGVGVGAYVSVDARSLLVHACLPSPEKQDQQSSDITLRGDFTGFSLGDLGKLAGFISGYTFTGLLPKTIPLADLFELRSASYVVSPSLGFIVAVRFEVRSNRPWVLIKDRFELDYVDVSFMINVPGTGTTIYWNLTSEMSIGGSFKVIAGVDSDLNLMAELAERVSLKPLLNQYFPAADLDFTINSLLLGLSFGESPPSWYCSLAVEEQFGLFDAVAAEEVQLSISGAGTSPNDVKISAGLALGDARFYLTGALNKGAGWDFTGRMTHDYNVQIVPNPDFDPDAPEGTPLKPIHVGNNASHFFGEIFDKLFPGAAASGVPPLLDVDIKSLGVQFNTKSKDFHFDAEIDFGKDVETVLTFSNLHQSGASSTTFEKRATGVITVFPGKANTFAFDVGLDLKPDSKHFVALYNNTALTPISIGDLVKAMFPDCPVEPPNFSITIKDVIVGYASEKLSGKAVSQSVFALDMGASLDLTSLGNIPLVGESLSAAKTLNLAFQLVYPVNQTGSTFAKADLAALNDLITVAGPRFPADKDLTELFVKTELRLGDGEPIDFSLPVKINTGNGQLQPDTSLSGSTFNPPGSQATDDGVKWIQLNKKFGPVHLQRAGFKFDNGAITALLDGSLTALGLEVDLMGLSVTSQVTDVKDGQFKPKFGLQGLGVSFSKGGVEIAGALLHLAGDEYDGLASVQAEKLHLAAIGSLTTVQGKASLFLYAALDYPLGGAPFFYVTGLAGGFGLNRQLVLPPVTEVSTFPLVEAALNPPVMPTDPGSAGTFITGQMEKLHDYLVPNIGQYFGCAGVRFTSFELVDSFILVCLSFGSETELDLLGMSTLVVPPKQAGAPALAVVSLQIAASLIPDRGIAIVQGQLTQDSHILDPKCHLSGGFAFASWFGPNPYAGDFVITLGGYHPDFQKPDYYPAVPRLGINWAINANLSVTGGLYFALTPRALMAGGALQAIFQVDLDVTIASASVKAWFMMGTDFIVYWKPFHYHAHLYIDMGIDVVINFLGTHDIGLDAGADLQVWGPPFGGHGNVSLKVIGIAIGFNVDFGASPAAPPPLDWENDTDASKSFRKSFLPQDDQIVSVAISAGLVRKVDLAQKQPVTAGAQGAIRGATSGRTGGDAPDVWFVINATDFRVRTNSVIPIKDIDSTSICWDDKNFDGNKDFGIAPMGRDKSKVNTFHKIEITLNGGPAGSQFVLQPILSHVPGGLWAEENSADVNDTRLIENAVTGFEIVPARPPDSGPTLSIPRDALSYTTHDMADAFTDHTINPFTSTVPAPGDDPAANKKIWTRIQREIHSNATRDTMLAAMGFSATDLDIGELFESDAAHAPSYGLLGN
jgi:hypothetical protein